MNRLSRIILNIFITLFVVATVYTARHDLSFVYQKAVVFLDDVKSSLTESKIVQKIESSKSIVKTIDTLDTITTPGPLVDSSIKNDNSGGLESNELNITIEGVISETNKHRRLAGLTDLVRNSKLEYSAELKVSDMFNKQYFEHISPSGESVDGLVKKSGYSYVVVGENLALGNFESDEALVKAWMESPGHRANILNSSYVDIGVFAMKETYKGEVVWLIVQHFGLSTDVCPSVDQKLHAQIVSTQQMLQNMFTELDSKKNYIESMEITNPTYYDEVEKYNKDVLQYQEEVKKVEEFIKLYNQGVTNFNNCITELK